MGLRDAHYNHAHPQGPFVQIIWGSCSMVAAYSRPWWLGLTICATGALTACRYVYKVEYPCTNSPSDLFFSPM
eukprot:15341378-Ditylum_brightwellii.AAC.1